MPHLRTMTDVSHIKVAYKIYNALNQYVKTKCFRSGKFIHLSLKAN